MERLVELVQRNAAERAQRFVGRTMEVLVEGPSRTDPSKLRGRTRHNKTVNFSGVARAGRARGRRDRLRHQHDAGRRGEPARAGRLSAPPVIAIFGPTAVGKTAVAVALAERLGGEAVAISADALQVYEGMPILTGAASEAERAQLEHRLVGFVPINRTFSVGEFMPLAHREIDDALAAGRTPIVVGGTGLYLRAALSELDLKPPPPADLRKRLEEEADRIGPEAMHARLAAARAPGGGEGPAGGPQPRHPPARAARDGRARGRGAAGRVTALDRGHAPPDAARRPDDGPRRAVRADRPARRHDGRRGRARGGQGGARRGRVGDRAQGARLRGAARRRHRGDEDAAAASTRGASSPGCASCRTSS